MYTVLYLKGEESYEGAKDFSRACCFLLEREKINTCGPSLGDLDGLI